MWRPEARATLLSKPTPLRNRQRDPSLGSAASSSRYGNCRYHAITISRFPVCWTRQAAKEAPAGVSDVFRHPVLGPPPYLPTITVSGPHAISAPSPTISRYPRLHVAGDRRDCRHDDRVSELAVSLRLGNWDDPSTWTPGPVETHEPGALPRRQASGIPFVAANENLGAVFVVPRGQGPRDVFGAHEIEAKAISP